MKLRLIAATAAALFVGQAFALTPAVVGEAATIKVYAAGASAIRNIVGQIFLQNCASNLDIYYSDNVAGGSFTSDGKDGDSHRVYTCTLKSDADLELDMKGKGLGGRNLAFFKRDAGGSAQGVFPVGVPSNTANLLVNASCTSTGNAASFDPAVGTTTPSYLCKSSENVRAPDLGFSDVEPRFFKGLNALSGFSSAGLTPAQVAGLTVVPTFQTVMAVGVSNALYTALQTAQNTAGVPSVPRTVIASMTRGDLQDPQGGLGWHALGVANPTQQVNICRRAAGSGTQAAANLMFSDFPCNSSNVNVPAKNGDSYINDDFAGGNTLTPPTWTEGSFYVYEASSSGNVANCLTNANAAGGYAIGNISRDTPPTANWKFVALDNVEPSRDNLKAGKYDYAVESTAQYRTTALNALNAGSADDKAKAGFITGFAKAVGRPVNMDKLATDTKNGLAALPSSGIYANPDNAIEAAFVSRVGRSNGNNCTPFSVVQ
ncbi:MAG: hypothetical protein A3E25_19630 [Burkholderiales bacterium RIFCSPHIGHO2_12_FULL_69_20]|nr:MAG: hypothetical protein A3E25_19630 [Burkholderiales bacterium RIFCSPHIGHO2_12_FULL_69_20]